MWWTILALLASVGAVMWGLALLARRVRRRGAAGPAIAAAMAAYDEAFHSTAHDTFVEMRVQDERGQQAPDSDGTRRGSAVARAADSDAVGGFGGAGPRHPNLRAISESRRRNRARRRPPPG